MAILATAGCTQDDAELPPACRQGGEAVREALRAAPRAVRIDGTRLSSCLGRRSDAGELRDVGTAYVDAASALAAEAAERPSAPEATQLGYLIGAARRGASATEGVNAELVRRLEQELLRVDTRSPAFRRGLRAGRRGG